jgi:ABC-type antimicrobial peptide transport system permease subunit
MKTVIKILVAVFLGLGLAQLIDLAFYLMNQSDSYLFNIGIVLFGIIFIAFGYLGLYLINVLDSKEEVKEEVKQNKKEN